MKYTTKLLIGFVYPANLTRQVVKHFVDQTFTYPDGKPEKVSFENDICVLTFNKHISTSYVGDNLKQLDLLLTGAAKIIELNNNGVNSLEIPDIGAKVKA